jgi:hypothetical protein
MPSSHGIEPNEIRHQGHNSNRYKGRFSNPVEERNGDLIGIVPTPILNAVWLLRVGVDGSRPTARQAPRSDTNHSGRAERPDRIATM